MHVTGGCQCGTIRYEFDGEPIQQVACHCTDCQHQSGSAFGMTVVVNSADFRITKGEPKLYHSTSSTARRKLGAFCPACGNRIYHQPEWRQGRISIKPGTMDDTSWLRPAVHLWTKSKQAWVIIPDDAETYERQPG
jgi:hypothetical protein